MTAASPDWMKSGFSSSTCPDEGSIFWSMDSSVQATCAVWAWKTGVYPEVMTEGCCITTIWAVNVSATLGGSSAGPHTSPRWMSSLPTPRTLNPTLSPGPACGTSSWCISMVLTSPPTSLGWNDTVSPVFSTPVSTRPTGTVPMPEMVYTS